MIEMEEISPGQLASLGTSDTFEDSSDNAIPPARASAAFSHATNTESTDSFEAPKSSYQTSDSSSINTPYRGTLYDPEVLGWIKSSVTSEVELAAEAELVHDQDFRTSNDLDIVKRPDLTHDTDYASIFTPIGDLPLPSIKISTFRVQEFQRIYPDGSFEKFFAIISNEPNDSATASQSGRSGLEVFSELFTMDTRNSFLRSLIMDAHRGPPDMKGLQSLFTPDYSPEELRPGRSESDDKAWDLGFNTRIFAESLRKNKKPTVSRYKMVADEATFDIFQTDKHRIDTEKVAWDTISSTIHPDLHKAPLSPGFEKLANDFFGGKEVQDDYAYAREAEFRIIDQSTGAKNHSITYDASEVSEDERQACCSDGVFARFLQDLTMCNDMEKTRLRGDQWHGAKVYHLIIGCKSEKIEFHALFKALKGMGKSSIKRSDFAESNVGGALSRSGLHIFEVFSSASESNEVPDASDSDATNTLHPQPANDSKGKTTAQNNENEGDDWMKTNAEDLAEMAPKKASKKRNKNRKKANQKAPRQANSAPDAETGEETTLLESSELRANKPVSKPPSAEEEPRSWKVVQTRLPPRQGRPLKDSLNRGSNAITSYPSGGQVRQPRQVSTRNHPIQAPSYSCTAQLPRQDIQNTATTKNATIRKPPLTPKSGVAPLHKAAPETPHDSRSFVPEEYPVLTTKAFAPALSSPIKPASQPTPLTQGAEKSLKTSVMQAPPKNPSQPKQVRNGAEDKLRLTPTSSKPTDMVIQSGTQNGHTSVPSETKVKKPAISPNVDSSSQTTTGTNSGSIPARRDWEGIPLEDKDRGGSVCEAPVLSLCKSKEVESSEDGEGSERSSATIQADVVPASVAELILPVKIGVHENDEEMIPAPTAIPQDQTPCHNLKGNEHETDDAASVCSEDSRDDASSVEILTSPSQRKNIERHRSNLYRNESNDDLALSDSSPSTIKSQSQSNSVRFDDGTSGAGLDVGDDNEDNASTTFELEAGQKITQAIDEEDSINIATPRTQVEILGDSSLPFILLTEAEASRSVFTVKIKIRTARHLCGGTNIPNYYSISSDSEYSETEMAPSKAKSSKVVSTKNPAIRSATHSGKTGKVITNFFYVSEDDTDSDVEQNTTINVEGQAGVMDTTFSQIWCSSSHPDDSEGPVAAVYTEPNVQPMNTIAVDFTATPSPGSTHEEELTATGEAESSPSLPDTATLNSQTSFLPFDGHVRESHFSSHAEPAQNYASDSETDVPIHNADQVQEFTDAPALNATVLDNRTSLALLDVKYEQEIAEHPRVMSARALSEINTPVLGGNSRSELTEQASAMNATASDFHMSVPLPEENHTQHSTYPECAEPAPHGQSLDETTSGLLTNLSPAYDNHAKLLSNSDYPGLAQNSATYFPHTPQHSAPPDEAVYHHTQFSDSGLAGAPGPNFLQTPPLPDHRHPVMTESTNSDFGSAIHNSQSDFRAGSPHKQAGGQYAGDGTGDSQTLGRSRDSSLVSTEIIATRTQTVSQFTEYCTYCRHITTPSIQSPQVLCSGCGPTCMIRYCSVACLLVDSFAHSGHCINYGASDRAAFHNLPGMFIYITNPITSVFGYPETSERFRQRAFSMYCNTGPFPPLFQTWMRKPGVTLSAQTHFDPNEVAKRTGDYTVFRSNTTLAPRRNNPNADAIYTIKFHQDDHKKQMLKRTLNACFLVWDSRIVEFLFRLLRHLILDPEYFSMFKYTEPLHVVWPEFEHQFKQEFSFEEKMFTCTTHFNSAIEWQYISGLIVNLEYRYPVLSQWFGH